MKCSGMCSSCLFCPGFEDCPALKAYVKKEKKEYVKKEKKEPFFALEVQHSCR